MRGLAHAAPRQTLDERGILQTQEGPRAFLSLGGLNLLALSPGARDSVALLWAGLMTAVQPGQDLHVLVESAPVDGAHFVATLVDQISPDLPNALRQFSVRWLDYWATQLAHTHSPQLRITLVVSPEPQTEHDPRATVMQRLERAVVSIERAVTRLRIGVERLDAHAAHALLERHLCRDGGSWRAPRFSERRDHVLLEDAPAAHQHEPFARSVFLVAPPDATDPGWLEPLLTFDAPCTISLHLHGLNPAKERKRLKRRGRYVRDAAMAQARGGAVDVDVEDTLGESREQARALRQRGNATARIGVYCTTFAPTRALLDERAASLLDTIAHKMGAEPGYGLGHQEPLYLSSLPLGRDVARSVYRWDAITWGNALPVLRPSPGTAAGYPLGFTRDGHHLVLLDFTDPALRNRLMSVLGQSGLGKTLLTQKLLTWFLLRGGWATVVDKAGGYRALVEIADGRIVQLGGRESASINVFAGARATDDELAERVAFATAAVEMLVSDAGVALDGFRRSLLEEGVRAVYAAHAEPLLHDLADWLLEQGKAEEWDATDRRVLRELAFRLRPYIRSGQYAMLCDRPTSVDLYSHHLLVFDLGKLSNRSAVRAFAMFAVTETVRRRSEHARALSRARGVGNDDHIQIVDEGWWMLQFGDPEYVASLGRMGRKDAATSIFASQKLSDVSHGAAADYFDQATLHAVFSIQDAGEVGDDRRLTPSEWLADRLRLTPFEVKEITEMAGVKHEYSQFFLIRGDRNAAQPAHGIVNCPVCPEERWAYASDDDDLAVLERERRRHGDVWSAICALVDHETPAQGVAAK